MPITFNQHRVSIANTGTYKLKKPIKYKTNIKTFCNNKITFLFTLLILLTILNPTYSQNTLNDKFKHNKS